MITVFDATNKEIKKLLEVIEFNKEDIYIFFSCEDNFLKTNKEIFIVGEKSFLSLFYGTKLSDKIVKLNKKWLENRDCCIEMVASLYYSHFRQIPEIKYYGFFNVSDDKNNVFNFANSHSSQLKNFFIENKK